ncbi:Thiol-disulfide oxidoreductase ResA [Rubripirellula tenax]|uniref:Thiol-disulfide oxidoreductase ResA n=1 Tax=Rubripirellula tenax TaxID=2528015 RepID=A0A5C6EFE2_9BACT|nr:TlpA disulfide reductase family protein [Rubripirellula tenax]TWU47300.1 Thiol-disulfide oxidoreductase ResA [Rubripirellula tenax]
MKFNRTLFPFLALWPVFAAVSASADVPDQTQGVLRISGQEFIAGSLADSSRNDTVAWQHPDFAAPFEFPTDKLLGLSFPVPDDVRAAEGTHCFELVGGDRLYGTIVGIDQGSIKLQGKEWGSITIDRLAVRRVYQWLGGDSVRFIGPGKLANWTVQDDDPDRKKVDGKEGEADDDSDPALGWSDRGGELQTGNSLTSIYRDVGLSRRTRVDIELAWDVEPQFALAFGVFETKPMPSAAKAFRLEVWDGELVAVWESEASADVVSLGSITSMQKQVTLSIEIDQQTHDAEIRSEQGEVIGRLSFDAPANFPPRPGIWMQSLGGAVTLRSLRVIQVASTRPSSSATQNDRSLDQAFLKDDESVSGTWTSVSEEGWLFVETESEYLLDPESVRQVDLGQPSDDPTEHEPDTEAGQLDKLVPEKPDSAVVLVTHAGIRLTGRLLSVSEGRVRFKPNIFEEPMGVPVSKIRSLGFSGLDMARPAIVPGTCRLQSSATKVHGKLVAAETPDSITPIRFMPSNGSAANMLPSFAGSLVYREPPIESPAKPKVRQVRVQPVRPLGAFLGVVQRTFGNNGAKSSTSPRAIHLRTGEIVPGSILTFDAVGVTISSTATSQSRLRHDQLLAVQMEAGQSLPEIDERRLQRLLTVPRVSKKNPPTHLIVARNGDVMRGRIKRIDRDTIEVESRLETVQLERSVVSIILWLHSDADEAMDGQKTKGFQVRANLRNGNRMSFVPVRMNDETLVGTSEYLGQCEVNFRDLDSLLIGDAISESTSDEPFAAWRLSDAPEPILLDDAGGSSPGVSSPLVGTKAPDFVLDQLDGRTFQLSNERGKVVVLDFWATWCGPCLQAMPQIDEAVSEFSSDDVVLVAVNLQEAAGPIRQTLKRLELDPTVALDIDGVAASRYQADAIPQTVVIDREGTITHLFVGGGPKLGDQLKEAIKSTIEKKP